MNKFSIALLSASLLAPIAQANNFDDANDAINYRQSAFGLISYQFGDMSAMLKGKKEFNQEVFASRAANVAALAKLPHEGFIPGSDQGKTDAAAKIWQDKADFDEKMSTFENNAALLAQAAQSGDKNKMKQAFMETGKSCKGCHDVYKKD
ncbi:cytochrome c [Shewanella sp. SR44-3]|uniref:c-type cytochrome n=1 Tax=unclassified Shewanella TaxID=196818 RepID=UPI0015FA3152|nr:cytochrome c [Shewanella sp. SR44-3]MBB1269216.1 cytochrome c [Shewanella sp. SR44-3]